MMPMQQQQMMMQQRMMMQQQMMMQQGGGMQGGMEAQKPKQPTRAIEVDTKQLHKVALQQKRSHNEKDKKETTIFVGGLRKTTDDEKLLAHFSKYGKIDKVDVKRLPDGTSRGFAFVKFMDKATVGKVVEDRAKHMIDNKWVAVVSRDSEEYGRHNESEQREKAEKSNAAKASQSQKRVLPREEPIPVQPERNADYEEMWSENYLRLAQQAGQAEAGEDGQEEGQQQMMMVPMGMGMGMQMGEQPMSTRPFELETPIPLSKIGEPSSQLLVLKQARMQQMREMQCEMQMLQQVRAMQFRRMQMMRMQRMKMQEAKMQGAEAGGAGAGAQADSTGSAEGMGDGMGDASERMQMEKQMQMQMEKQMERQMEMQKMQQMEMHQMMKMRNVGGAGIGAQADSTGSAEGTVDAMGAAAERMQIMMRMRNVGAAGTGAQAEGTANAMGAAVPKASAASRSNPY